jgi:nitrite reductase (NADH) small subunit
MTLAPEAPVLAHWHTVCRLSELLPGRGAAALIDGHQIALFRLADDSVYAVGNHDPYSGAHVISRGIVGSRGAAPTVASPLYKQVFDLRDGACLDDPTGPGLTAHPVRLAGDTVEVCLT